MKFNFISKSDFSKYESSKPSDTEVSVSSKAKAPVSSKVKTAGATKAARDYFREKRELKRRIRQVVQRYIKRALIQREN